MEKINQNLEQKILEKIKNEKLSPKPIWYFLIRDYSLWLAVILSIILASLSIAPIIFIFSNLEIEYIKHISSNIFLFILFILPYPWIILCAITTYLAKKAWFQTRSGYKFQGKYIVIISVITSLILGIILNLYTFGKVMDDGFHNNSFGFYKNLDDRKQENWFNPKEGRLIGIVKNVSSSTFVLFNQKNNFEEIVNFDETVPGFTFVNESNQIRVIGYEKDNSKDSFFACAIFPDNLEPGRSRPEFTKDRKKDMQNKMKDRFETNPECKEMFEAGRANYLKQK